MIATNENVFVGDLITWAYSYSARIPKFGRIIRKTNSSVWIEELPRKVVSHDGYGQNGTCIADINGTPIEKKKSFRFSKRSGYLKIDGQLAYLHNDLKPEDFYTD
jgi:hypothetical protein